MYHSMQTQIVSRWGASQLQAVLHAVAQPGNVAAGQQLGRPLGRRTRLIDFRILGRDFGLANTDRRHVFNAALVLALPDDGRDHSGVKAAAARRLGDRHDLPGGRPARRSPSTRAALPGLNGGPSGTGLHRQPAAQHGSGGDCRASDSANPEQILNPAAFTLTGFQLGTIGNEKRGAVPRTRPVPDRPRVLQDDAGLRAAQLQLRFEIFNVFNRTNFLSTGLNTTLNPMTVQFDTGDAATATQITGYTLPGNFGQATATRDPRQAQFGLKIIF